MVTIAVKRVDTVGTLAFVFISMEHVWQDVMPVFKGNFVKCVRMRGDYSFRWSDIDIRWDRNKWK